MQPRGSGSVSPHSSCQKPSPGSATKSQRLGCECHTARAAGIPWLPLCRGHHCWWSPRGVTGWGLGIPRKEPPAPGSLQSRARSCAGASVPQPRPLGRARTLRRGNSVIWTRLPGPRVWRSRGSSPEQPVGAVRMEREWLPLEEAFPPQVWAGGPSRLSAALRCLAVGN